MHGSTSSGGAAFALAGDFYDDIPKDQGYSGFYWSFTVLPSSISSIDMYGLSLRASDTNVLTESARQRLSGGLLDVSFSKIAVSKVLVI